MAQNNKNKIKVGIVEKNRRLRESLAESIRSQNNMVVAFSIPELDGHSTAADVVLLPWEIFAGPLYHQWSAAKYNHRLLLTNADPRQHGFFHRLRRGANGFVPSDSTEEEILSAIRTVMETGWAVPHLAAVKLYSEIAEGGTMEYYDAGLLEVLMLTNREREILRLILKDLSNGEIANQLNIATSTVKNHVHNILKKSKTFGLRDRTDLSSYLRKVKSESDSLWDSEDARSKELQKI